MPRSSIVLSREPVEATVVARAAGEVWQRFAEPGSEEFELRTLDDGAALQVLADGTVVLTVLRPRLLPAPAERERILPGASVPDDAAWWSETYTPWTPASRVGIEILEAVARAASGRVEHQGLGPSDPARGSD